MYIRLLLMSAALFSAWSISPDAWGWTPGRGPHFIELSDQTLPTPTAETAVIVFVLPADGGDMISGLFFGFSNLSLLYDVTTETPKLLGAIRFDAKTAFEVSAGEYMLQSMNLLAISVVAGRTYYIHVDAPGSIGRYSKLTPVRNGAEGEWQYSSKYIQNALDIAVLVKTQRNTEGYYGKGSWSKGAGKIRKKLLKKWNAKSESERQKLTLNPEDGVLHEHYSNQSAQFTYGVKEESSFEKTSPSYSDQLEALESLRDDGIFTEEEFQKQKAKLLEK